MSHITADQLVTLTIDLVDPLQPPLPSLPEPRHLVSIHITPLETLQDAHAWATGGVWLDGDLENSATVSASLDVRDGDDQDSTEARVMAAVSTLFTAVEWLDMDLLGHQYHNDPDMDDRLALAYVHAQEILGDQDTRRWVGMTNLRLVEGE